MNIPGVASFLAIFLYPLLDTHDPHFQELPLCTGHTCTADATLAMVAPLGWSITITTTNGKGRDVESSCEPCKSCKFKTVWSYDGDYSFTVHWEENWYNGSASGSGFITTFMGCDAVTESITFAAGGSSAGQVDLICPCN